MKYLVYNNRINSVCIPEILYQTCEEVGSSVETFYPIPNMLARWWQISLMDTVVRDLDSQAGGIGRTARKLILPFMRCRSVFQRSWEWSGWETT